MKELEHLTGHLISVEVVARDRWSARRLADDRIGEARAILHLADGRVAYEPGPKDWYLTGERGEVVGESSGVDEFFAVSQWRSPDNELGGPFSVLSSAARKPEDSRTDWERRTVAACRWYAEAAIGRWPAKSLVDIMAAFDCLYVPNVPRRKGDPSRGERIAHAVTRKWLLLTRDAEEQRAWITDLYARRNDAIHEGRRFAEEIQIEDLLQLLRQAVLRAAWHLDPWHGGADRESPCETLDEVLEHDQRLAEGDL